MRRLVCVWLPHWPITRLRRSDALDRPLVAVETLRGQRSLAATGPAAEDRGLYCGQTLANARHLSRSRYCATIWVRKRVNQDEKL